MNSFLSKLVHLLNWHVWNCHEIVIFMKSQVHTPWRMARKRAPSHQRNRAVSLPGVGKSEPKRSSLSNQSAIGDGMFLTSLLRCKKLKVTVGHTFCFPYLEVCNITRNFIDRLQPWEMKPIPKTCTTPLVSGKSVCSDRFTRSLMQSSTGTKQTGLQRFKRSVHTPKLYSYQYRTHGVVQNFLLHILRIRQTSSCCLCKGLHRGSLSKARRTC